MDNDFRINSPRAPLSSPCYYFENENNFTVELNQEHLLRLKKDRFTEIRFSGPLQLACSMDEFALGYFIAFGEHFLERDLSDKLWENPDLHEHLDHFFTTLFPISREIFLQKFDHDYLRCNILPRNAWIILEDYAKRHSSDWIIATLRRNPNCSDHPLCVQYAFRVAAQSMYYPTAEEAEKNYSEIQRYQNEISKFDQRLQVLIKEKNSGLADLCEQKFKLIEGETRSAEKAKNTYLGLKKNLEMLMEKRFVPYRYQEYENSSCPFMQYISQKGYESLEAYRACVVQLLQQSNERLYSSDPRENRRDLLEYLVGPKAFMFDYYDIFPVLIEERGKSLEAFTYIDPYFFNYHKLSYQLQNPSPFDLEDEIRRDRLRIAEDHRVQISLPPRIVQEEEVTIRLSNTMMQYAQDLFQKTQRWGILTQEEKNGVVCAIYSYNGWNAYNLETLSLEEVQFHQDKAEGKLSIKKPEGIELYDFFMSFYDFQLVVKDPSVFKPNSVSTKKWLARNFKRIYSFHF